MKPFPQRPPEGPSYSDRDNAKPTVPPVRVQWSISATMECPHCEHDNDFMQVDEYWNLSKVGENVEKFNCPIEVTCEECGKEFTVDGADY